VVIAAVTPVSTLRNRTEPPLIAAPAGSETTPWMLLLYWAKAGSEQSHKTERNDRRRERHHCRLVIKFFHIAV